jgi:hypothetical protein
MRCAAGPRQAALGVAGARADRRSNFIVRGARALLGGLGLEPPVEVDCADAPSEATVDRKAERSTAHLSIASAPSWPCADNQTCYGPNLVSAYSSPVARGGRRRDPAERVARARSKRVCVI